MNRIFLWGESLIERGAWFFAPLSGCWALAAFVKNLLYDFRILSSASLPCTVVSVGNIVAGGTGKTPFVHFLAKTLVHRKVAILSRGYGPFADEAALLAKRLPQVKVYVGKNRIVSGKKAAAEGAEVVILDDGFQYRKLARDFDIVLLNHDDPLGKGHYLPRGYLRDSPRRLPQADALFFYGKDFKMRVERILNLQGEEIASIKGWRVALFSAIAKPGRFKKTVIDLGAEVISERIFRDHALIPLDQLTRWAKQSGAKALLCTEKDAVKLPPSFDAGVPILFLEIEMEILCHRVSWENLIAKIDQKIDNHAPICKKK